MNEQQKTLDAIADWLHSVATAAPMNDAAEAIRMGWPLRETHDGFPPEAEMAAFRAQQQEAAKPAPEPTVTDKLSVTPEPEPAQEPEPEPSKHPAHKPHHEKVEPHKPAPHKHAAHKEAEHHEKKKGKH